MGIPQSSHINLPASFPFFQDHVTPFSVLLIRIAHHFLLIAFILLKVCFVAFCPWVIHCWIPSP